MKELRTSNLHANCRIRQRIIRMLQGKGIGWVGELNSNYLTFLCTEFSEAKRLPEVTIEHVSRWSFPASIKYCVYIISGAFFAATKLRSSARRLLPNCPVVNIRSFKPLDDHITFGVSPIPLCAGDCDYNFQRTSYLVTFQRNGAQLDALEVNRMFRAMITAPSHSFEWTFLVFHP